MDIIKGISASKGISIGKAFVYNDTPIKITKYTVSDVEKEVIRFKIAQDIATSQLDLLYEQSIKHIAEEDAKIFVIHKYLIIDSEFNDDVISVIKNEVVNAEYAVNQVSIRLQNIFLNISQDYFKERAIDIIDISSRLINILQKKDYNYSDLAHSLNSIDYSCIIIGNDFMPSQTISFNKDNVLAVATVNGSRLSHSSILARTIGIPAVVGLGKVILDIENGTTCIIDGEKGELIVEPDDKTLAIWANKKIEYDKKREQLLKYKDKKAITKDNKRIKVTANINSVNDIRFIIENGAEGIGLFRSEFIYMCYDQFPTQEEQFAIYSDVLKQMGSLPTVIRLLDIGSDKSVPYIIMPNETNPALGLRGIRYCIENPEVLVTQLLSLLRASVYGNLKILIPMVTTVDEVLIVKNFLDDLKKQLTLMNIPFKQDIPIGVLIETPAAALISDELAKISDFFSIGTNDLTQYTLASDRLNMKFQNSSSFCHKAILKLIAMIAQNAKNANIPVSVCGDLASNVNMVKFFIDNNISQLSVPASNILDIKAKIIES